MNVLSLFDGMSCGQIALNNLGIPYSNYFASEIDKHSIAVTQANYPATLQLGDIDHFDETKLPSIDLLIGGSPCQGFSLMGKQQNFDVHRSKLFVQFVYMRDHFNPKYFLLENVKMKKEWVKIITDYMGVEPIEINSSLVSAQKRKRLYWTNIPVEGLPVDRGVTLNRLLEQNVDEKYFLKDKRLENWNKNAEYRLKKQFSALDPLKAICMTARQYANWYGNHVTDEDRIRQLTPVECERLQNVPDDYTSCVIDKHRYRMLGDGWTVKVIEHILSFMDLN